MWSIAVKTLVADRGKLLTALVGVCFSVILVNIQGGLYLGLVLKASVLVDHGQADIWVGHRKMINIDFPRDIPRRWIYRIKGLPGIARAEPYMVGITEMTLPGGGYELAVVVGVEEGSLLGNTWNIKQGEPGDIFKTDGIITDELEDTKLDHPDVGQLREIGGVRARVVAKSRGVMGFLVNPYVFTTYQRAARFLNKPADACSYFLVQVEPGVDPASVCAAIRARIPDVEAYTREEYSAVSASYWITRTGLGISFGAATLLGVLVGLVMVAETLYAFVLDRLSEFGALKAMGAKEWHIFVILMSQASVMALLGGMLGVWMVSGIQYLFSTAKAPILIPLWLSLGSCLLVFIICLVSVLLPYLRIRKVDPLVRAAGRVVERWSCSWSDEDTAGSGGRSASGVPSRRDGHAGAAGVTMLIERGECVFLVGPSGCGKSTLLSVLGCILTPDEGEVQLFGQDVRRLVPAARTRLRRERIGFVFQRFHLIRGLTAFDNVLVPLRLQGWGLRKARARVLELLEAVGLADKAGVSPKNLSAGQCQRVAFARALVADPDLILADEPTASLDDQSGQEAMNLLRTLIKDQHKTAVVVTHDTRIFRYADRIYAMHDGVIEKVNRW